MPSGNPSSSSSSSSRNPLRGAVEIIPDRLYYCALKSPPASNKLLLRNRKQEKVPVKCFCIDDELVYWNFFSDFGPLNLGQLYRFTVQLNGMLVEQSQNDKHHPVILFYSSTQPAKRTNAIYLICAWQVLEMKRSPEQAFYGFQYYMDHDEDDPPPKRKACSMPPPTPLSSIAKATIAPLPPFHDASPVACTYDLTIVHCLQGIVKAKQLNFFDWESFNLEEYEYFEQVENGDLNWIIQDKIIAFAGPSYKKVVSPEGYCTLSPAEYIPYFKSRNVALVVRLNKKNYNEQDFIQAGIDHLDQFYLDGSCPPMSILQRVLAGFEAVPSGKAFAVHCKAGLGRTGTCIGAYMMKHYRMTAPEVIGWMRICRPGCVIGPQQQFLQDLEPIMWQEGDMMRIDRGIAVSVEERRSGEKKRSSTTTGRKKTSTPPQPEAPILIEAAEGRPGQAEGLLASRRQRHTVKVPTQSKAPTPVPITPDSVSGKEASSKGFFASGTS